MAFTPILHQHITIDKVPYQFMEHPNARGQTYRQIGKRAEVFQLAAPGGQLYALKVFKTAFRTSVMVDLSARLRQFAHLPGLAVCERTILTPSQHKPLLDAYPDLTYAALMPWMTGESWTDIILPTDDNGRRTMTQAQSQQYASSFATTIATLERHQIAHCDLSGPNVILMPQTGTTLLVDVEDMYAPGLSQPAKLPAGSPGYAHRTAPVGLWSAQSDRFSAAVLIAEMLAWCDARIRSIAHEENYWKPDEMQQERERYTVMMDVLHTHWGSDIARTFNLAWMSKTLADCPSLATWAALLGASLGASPSTRTISTPIAPPLPSSTPRPPSTPIAPPLPPSTPVAPPLPAPPKPKPAKARGKSSGQCGAMVGYGFLIAILDAVILLASAGSATALLWIQPLVGLILLFTPNRRFGGILLLAMLFLLLFGIGLVIFGFFAVILASMQ